MLAKYLQRHQHPANLCLHIVALPLTFVVPVVLLLAHQGWWALGAFVGGYALQFLGHAIEGNDAGETIVLKKLLGKPYVAVIPRTDKPKHVPSRHHQPEGTPSARQNVE